MRNHIVSIEEKEPGFLEVVGEDPYSGREWVLLVPTDGFEAWEGGELIQVALPTLTSAQREMLMTGYTQESWTAMFGEPQEDEPDCDWEDTVAAQGWNQDSQIFILMSFIQSKGLQAELDTFAADAALAENGGSVEE